MDPLLNSYGEDPEHFCRIYQLYMNPDGEMYNMNASHDDNDNDGKGQGSLQI